MSEIPQAYVDILHKKAFAHLATLMPDGAPQSSPVWIDYRDGRILINSARGRIKDRNIRHDPRVSISVTDPDNPYRCLMVRGRVVEITEEGADEHIDSMAKKYLGQDSYPRRAADEVRVLYSVEPDKVGVMG